ncbi:unnamed protein product, partial [Polarella glacialis]
MSSAPVAPVVASSGVATSPSRHWAESSRPRVASSFGRPVWLPRRVGRAAFAAAAFSALLLERGTTTGDLRSLVVVGGPPEKAAGPAEVLCENGILYASPYLKTVRVKLASRVGRRLGDVLEDSQSHVGSAPRKGLGDIPPSWWEEQLRQGNVAVQRCAGSGVRLETIDADYIVQSVEDRVHLPIHVHELVAPNVEPEVIYEDRDYLVVSKPAGVDIFPNPGTGHV